MCKVKTPAVPALPPPRAQDRLPSRSGIATGVERRLGAAYGGRPQVPDFALPITTAKLGGVPTVLGA